MRFAGPCPDPAELAGIDVLFTDVDDTITTGGRLLAETYEALWALHDAGIAVVPVTGGSAGWCDHICRTWPVAAAVAENGALYMTRKPAGFSVSYWDGPEMRMECQRVHLLATRALLDDRYTGFAISDDQPFRLADVAIDITGKPGMLVDQLCAQLRDTGATATVSSIHINTWLGTYSKRTMSERVLVDVLGIKPDQAGERVAFVGDSRNDASMFAWITNSFGVANIAPYLNELAARPRWIAEREAGLGFKDIAATLIAARAHR